MSKILTWAERLIKRQKVKFDAREKGSNLIPRRFDIHLTVYSRVEEGLDVEHLMRNTTYNFETPHGMQVFRVELEEFKMR